MNKKKLCASSLALALSLGSIAPGLSDAHIQTAYASETGSDARTEISNSTLENISPAADQTENLTNDQKKANLEAFVAEKESVEKSPRYLNASTSEKTTYENTVNAAALAIRDNNLANYETLKSNIEKAKANLGANLMNSADNRDALRYNIATAEKLGRNSKVYGDRLTTAITKAKDDLKNTELSDAQIANSNKTLSSVIADVAEKAGVDVTKATLTNSELDALKSEDNVAYNRLRARLYQAITDANNLVKVAGYDNLSNADKTAFTNQVENAVEAFNSTSSSTADLETAYGNLLNSYNSVASAIDAKDTELSRTTKALTALVNDDHNTFIGTNEYKLANKFSKANYNQAVETARVLLGDTTASLAQLQNAQRNVTIAKLSVVPVPTKTLNGDGSNNNSNNNQPINQTANLDGLKSLINEAKTVREGNDYTNAKKADRDMYDNAITTATLVRDKTNPTVDEIKNAADTINNAKASLKTSAANNANETQLKDSLSKLKSLLDNSATVKASPAYKSATDEKQKAYDKAIEEGLTLSNDHVSGKTPATVEKANQAIVNINSALGGIGYSDNISYPTSLKELIDEATSFRQTSNYVRRSNSNEAADKLLIKTYNDLIQAATNYNKESNKNEAVVKSYVDRINDVKRAINNQISIAELNLRGFVANDGSYKLSKKYDDASKSSNEALKEAATRYNTLIAEAKQLLNSTDKTDARMTTMARRLQDVVTLIENPTEEAINLYKLQNLVEMANIAKANSNYSSAPQQNRTDLEKALTKANEVIANTSRTKADIDSAVSNLEAALNARSIKDLIQTNPSVNPNVKSKYDLDTMTLEELQALAIKVTEHPNFSFAYGYEQTRLANAIEQAKQANHNGSDKDKNEAKAELIKQLRQVSINALIERIRDTEGTNLANPDYVRELKELVEYAQKVRDAEGYLNIPVYKRDLLSNNYNSGINNIKIGSKAAILENIKALRENLSDSDIKPYLDKLGLKLSDIKEYTENTNTNTNTNTQDISTLGLDKLIELAEKVIAHADYKDVGATQGKNLKDALDAAKAAKTDEEKKEAQTALLSALNQSEIRPIVTKVRASGNVSVEAKDLTDLKQLIEFTKKVMDHGDYYKVDEKLRSELGQAFINAKAAADGNDEAKIKASKDELNRLLSDERLKSIVDEIRASAIISPKSIIEKIVSEDEAFRKTDKFKRAQKSLQDIYIKVLNEANTLAKNENAKDADLKTASDALVAAKNSLDGDQFAARVKALKEKYASEKDSISDAAKKADIEKLIAALDSDDATMDNLLAAEAALKSAPKLTGSATPVTTTTTTTTTTPVPTTTTTPVTTTSTVPATINPGSIVRTGIKSLIGVAVILALAVGAFVITGKNKDNKNKTKKVYESDSNKKGE